MTEVKENNIKCSCNKNKAEAKNIMSKITFTLVIVLYAFALGLTVSSDEYLNKIGVTVGAIGGGFMIILSLIIVYFDA